MGRRLGRRDAVPLASASLPSAGIGSPTHATRMLISLVSLSLSSSTEVSLFQGPQCSRAQLQGARAPPTAERPSTTDIHLTGAIPTVHMFEYLLGRLAVNRVTLAHKACCLADGCGTYSYTRLAYYDFCLYKMDTAYESQPAAEKEKYLWPLSAKCTQPAEWANQAGVSKSLV